MNAQAWSYLSPRTLTPQADRLSTGSRVLRQKPPAQFERALDLFYKGRTATGRSSGEGGGAVITPEDVKLALKDLDGDAFAFGMAAFLGDAKCLRVVETRLVTGLRRMADAGGWLQSRGDFERLERVASVMIFEAISARSSHQPYAHEEQLPEGSVSVRCPKCNGTGEFVDTWMARVWRRYADRVRRAGHLDPVLRDALLERARLGERKALAVECDLCLETGRYVFTQSSRARAAGIPRRTWTRTWAERYQEGMDIPRRWESIAVSHVRRKLRIED